MTMYFNMCATVLISLFLLSFGSCGIIIPEELPSLLSVAYSNIPPIKKGNDHRVGFGFAFGNHADLQVLLELGPQTNTKTLDGTPFGATSGSSTSGNAKRQAPNVNSHKINKNKEKFLHTDAGNYLQRWAEKMKQPQSPPLPPKDEIMNLEDSLVELVKNEKGEYEIHQPKPDHIPQEVLDNLKILYGKKKEEARKLTEQKRNKGEVRRITEDLSNVDLD